MEREEILKQIPKTGYYVNNKGEQKTRPRLEILFELIEEGKNKQGIEQYEREIEEFIMTIVITDHEMEVYKTPLVPMIDNTINRLKAKKKELKNILKKEAFKTHKDRDPEGILRVSDCCD